MCRYLAGFMKKIIYLILITAFFNSCEKPRYGILNFHDNYNIIYYHNFENNTLGNYRESEWENDWNFPAWSEGDIPPEIITSGDMENDTRVMRWHFPEGSLGPSQGGGQWYTELNSAFDELYFSYKVRFKPGFNWVLGGKIPGLRGGPEWPGADPPGWSDGFVALLMWNSAPKITFYYYHQDQDHLYGDSKAWNYNIVSGIWYTITIRIVMNTVNENGGNNDGILEGFIDRKLACQVTNLRFRNLESIGIDKLWITSFFGGNTEDWAAQRDEWIEFDDFVAFTYKDNVIIPRGNTPSPSGRILLHPEL